MTIHKEGHRMLLKFLALEVAVIYGAIHFFPHLPFVKYGIITVAAAMEAGVKMGSNRAYAA